MYVETVGTTTETTVAAGAQVNTASRDYQKGIYSIEVAGTTGTNPTVKIYGKLIKSDDESVDSGWVELLEQATITGDSVVGGTLDIFPYMSFSVANNDGARNIQVTIAYNHKA